MKLCITLMSLALATAGHLAAESNWPQWRGPLFNGSSPTATGLATEWTTRAQRRLEGGLAELERRHACGLEPYGLHHLR